MVIFEIRDSSINSGKLLGFLFYYEKSGRFFTELLSSVNEWDAPFIFSGFVKKKQHSIDSEWSMRFVRQRIIPYERQNLGEILKENKLKAYDEYRLLLLSEGRCAQDELYLVKTEPDELPKEIQERLAKKVCDVIPLSDSNALIFFKDNSARKTDIGKLIGDNRLFANVLKDNDIFNSVKVSPGGNGIEWGTDRFLAAELLYSSGIKSHISYGDMISFVRSRLIDTSEAARILGCSRQYINQLVKQGKLHPILSESNNRLFLLSEIETE